VIASKIVSNDDIIDACHLGGLMRTTVNLDDELLIKATKMSGVNDRSLLLKEALTALIQRESARRLASLGGSEPQIKTVPRRRP
jgi:Arc/MetJ family transcription regulator